MYWKLILIFVHLVTANNLNRHEKTLRINTDLTQPNVAVGLNVKNNDTLIFHNNENNNNNNKNNDNNRYNVQSMEWNANLTHICTREETYIEQLKIPTMEPVRVRSSNWCLEFPPRCSTYKTEMRELIKVQNITKTRTIRFCCAGYEGNISVNDTVCKPVCRGGCGHGYCETPDVCSCEAGYTGTHCTQRCDHDHWGLKCQHICQCVNGAVCDNKSGICHCTAGWTGSFCELPCPGGTFGIMCRQKCTCPQGAKCHPQTGVCGEYSVSPMTDTNMTNVMIETLNSTIVNITQNLDRIAKNIINISPSAAALPELEPNKNLHDVILIKQDEQNHSPKIIVHNADANTAILENLQSAKSAEVIHVITNWPHQNNSTVHQLNLAGIGSGQPHEDLTPRDINTIAQHDANLLNTVLIILLIMIIGLVGTFMYLYRCNYWQKQTHNNTPHAANISGGVGLPVVLNEELSENSNKCLFNTLPDFTKVARNKFDGPASCESSRKSSNIESIPYTYARKESMYSVVTPKSRKSSPDSHLYDEIRYPTFNLHYNDHQHQHHQQQHQQQFKTSQRLHVLHPTHMECPESLQQQNMVQQQNNFNDTITTYHTTRLIVPKVNANFLHVPQMTQKIAHI